MSPELGCAFLPHGLRNVVVIQTLAIGFGLIGGEKLADLSEQRRVAVAEFEAALEEKPGRPRSS